MNEYVPLGDTRDVFRIAKFVTCHNNLFHYNLFAFSLLHSHFVICHLRTFNIIFVDFLICANKGC